MRKKVARRGHFEFFRKLGCFGPRERSLRLCGRSDSAYANGQQSIDIAAGRLYARVWLCRVPDIGVVSSTST